jgi:hypothetical protein
LRIQVEGKVSSETRQTAEVASCWTGRSDGSAVLSTRARSALNSAILVHTPSGSGEGTSRDHRSGAVGFAGHSVTATLKLF